MDDKFYEEVLEQEQVYGHEKKHNFKWFIWVIIIVLFGIGSVVIYLRLNEKDAPKEAVNNQQEMVQEIKKIDLDCESECTYDLTVDSSKINVKYTQIKSVDDTIMHKLQIDDNIIVNQEFACGGPAFLSVLEDIILISYHDGCDSYGNTLHAYTKEGEEIFNYEYLDNTYNMWMEGTDYSVIGKKISVPATRIYHGLTLRLNANRELNICESPEWTVYGVDLTTVASGTYEIIYEGNSKFSNPVLVNSKTLEDIIQSCK